MGDLIFWLPSAIAVVILAAQPLGVMLDYDGPRPRCWLCYAGRRLWRIRLRECSDLRDGGP